MSTRHRINLVACIGVLGVLVQAPRVIAYTPESPKVQSLVRTAVQFIEQQYNPNEIQPYMQELGAPSLVGLVMLKHTRERQHPLIKSAAAHCQRVVNEHSRLFVRPGIADFRESNYSLGLALIFLCELDAEFYRAEIATILDALLRRQQPEGGWSYATRTTGDTSQTQYAVLGLWMAHRHKIPVPQDVVERVCGYLIRTQAPNGSWGYEAEDSGTLGRRVRQDRETLSLAAAGVSSVYVCADLLGFISGPQARRSRNRVPAGLREVGGGGRRSGPVTNHIPRATLQKSMGDGNRWFNSNFNIEAENWQHYYMYALERYQSFREYAERRRNAEPAWYNQGVEFLESTQNADGSWSDSYAGKVVDTAFAVLFLLRSTRNSIGRVVEESGRLRGGKLLPSDLTELAVNQQGEVVSTKEIPPVEGLLQMLEDLGAGEIDTSIPRQLKLSDDPTQRASQLARMRRLVTSGPFQARLTAATTLGSLRDFENVPALIFALDDPDPNVARAARDGLRFISRKVEGFGLSSSSGSAELEAGKAQWIEWYRTVRPNGGLLK